MKIKIKNLGPIRQAEFELGKMTVICGENNTGKTYMTHATYGYLYFWNKIFKPPITPSYYSELMETKTLHLKLQIIEKGIGSLVNNANKEYMELLRKVFASRNNLFQQTEFNIELSPADIHPMESYEHVWDLPGQHKVQISKKKDIDFMDVSLLLSSNNSQIPESAIRQIIGSTLKDIAFNEVFPKPFIACAERTGVALFSEYLNPIQHHLTKNARNMESLEDIIDLFSRDDLDFSLPLKDNIDLTRKLRSAKKNSSFISDNHPKILEEFEEITGGDFKVSQDVLWFTPKNKTVKLSMPECSSSVKALLILDTYLRHLAQKGDMLIIDEPEINLHPQNQRRIARLFSKLVNLGVNVFITTHSDYIVKELNTLIMLKQDKPHIVELKNKLGYKDDELLSINNLKVYIAEEKLIKLEGRSRKSMNLSLTPAEITPELGVNLRSFDKTINDMNKIHHSIRFGGAS